MIRSRILASYQTLRCAVSRVISNSPGTPEGLGQFKEINLLNRRPGRFAGFCSLTKGIFCLPFVFVQTSDRLSAERRG
jgi:hypothetical protein